MKSLKEYFPDEFETINGDNYHLRELEKLITTSFVVSNSINIDFSEIKLNLDHKQTVDQCIVHLLKRKLYNNVITYGYVLGKNNSVNKVLHCSGVNTNVTQLKSSVWEQFHKHVGSLKFINLLINKCVIQWKDNKYIQVVGSKMNEPLLPRVWYDFKSRDKDINRSFVSNKPFLYNNLEFQNKIKLFNIADNVESICNVIFPPKYAKLPKSCKLRVKYLVSKMLKKSKTGLYSRKLLNNVCPIDEYVGGESHLDRCTPKNSVVRLVLLALEIIIPIEMFGSKRNKSNIFSQVSELINLPLNGLISFRDIVDKIKLKDFNWLQDSKSTFGKSSFSNLVALSNCFIFWLFNSMIPKIISSFFYCTEVSGSVDVRYFRQDVWKLITAPFLKEYFDKNLLENPICRNHYSYTLSEFNHSNLRIVPKKARNEFRIIAVPHRGSDQEEVRRYLHNHRKYIVPTQKILEHIRKDRKTDFVKISTTTDIPLYIRKFKSSLLLKYRRLPKLHYLKFDIASCYDSIPREKVLEVLNKALTKEPGFFVRSSYTLGSDKERLNLRVVVNGSRKPQENDVYIDKVQTMYVTKENLIKIVEDELYRTSLLFHGSCYIRREGLYQGSCLSSSLVNLIYDDLLCYYPEFRPYDKTDTLILRLADDFLVISTSREQVTDIYNLAMSGFTEYNASVKHEKIMMENSQTDTNEVFQFCAMNVNKKYLEIWKAEDSFNVPQISRSSQNDTYLSLNWILRLRLSYGTLDERLNSIDTILKQIFYIINNLSLAFMKAFRRNSCSMGSFKYFFEEIVNLLVETSNISSIDILDYSLTVKLVVILSFVKNLQMSKTKYKCILSLLNEECMKLMDIVNNVQ